jgi:hypothetical protein
VRRYFLRIIQNQTNNIVIDMKKAFAAFDPGKNGGVAILNERGDIVFTATIPKIGSEIDLNGLNKLVNHIKNFGETQHVILERVHSIFGVGAASNFTFGQVNGFIEGMIVAAGLKYTKTNPREWQKIAWEGVDVISNKVIKYKTDKKTGLKVENGIREKVDTKKTSLIAAKRLFPNWSFVATERSKKDHGGLVDAALIAYYGYVKFR